MLFLAPGLAVGWNAYGSDESAPFIIIGAKDVRIFNE